MKIKILLFALLIGFSACDKKANMVTKNQEATAPEATQLPQIAARRVSCIAPVIEFQAYSLSTAWFQEFVISDSLIAEYESVNITVSAGGNVFTILNRTFYNQINFRYLPNYHTATYQNGCAITSDDLGFTIKKGQKMIVTINGCDSKAFTIK